MSEKVALPIFCKLINTKHFIGEVKGDGMQSEY